MRIEHVAMYVNDLEAAKNFFEKYLGTSANEKLMSLPDSLRRMAMR